MNYRFPQRRKEKKKIFGSSVFSLRLCAFAGTEALTKAGH